jgi:hypothetical protein
MTRFALQSNSGEQVFRRDVERNALQVAQAVNDCILRLENNGTINVKDYGATGDGVTDDTASINMAIAAANGAGGGVVVVPGYGTYMVNADLNGGYSIMLLDNVTLYVSMGATLRAMSNNLDVSAVVSAFGQSNVSVIGFGTIDGNRDAHIGSSGEHGMCLWFAGCDHVSVRDVRCVNGWGDGVYFGIDNTTPNTNVTMQGVYCYNNRRQGCSVVALQGGVISDCVFTNTNGTAPESGIDLEPDVSGAVDGVTVTNCISLDNAGAGIVLTLSATNCRLHHNYIARCAGNGITIAANGGGNTVDHNTVADLTASVRGAYDVTVGAIGCLVAGNTARNIETGSVGFYVHSGASSIILRDNLVDSLSQSAGAANGIDVYAPDTIVEGNVCRNIGGIGLTTQSVADRCYVAGNMVVNTVGRGFYLNGANITAIGNTAVDVASVATAMIMFVGSDAHAIGNRAILTSTDTAVVPFSFASAALYRTGNLGLGTQAYVEVLSVAIVPYMGNATAGVRIANAAGDFTGTIQYGFFADLTTGSDATSGGIGSYLRSRTTAASYTQSLAADLYTGAIIKGSGSTITKAVGVYCEAQTVGNTNYALETATGGDAKLGGLLYLAVPGSYANDSAASSGGVAVGEVYRNGSVLMIRVT